MLTKAEEAKIANDKARINDLVSIEVLASYGKDGQLDKTQLLTNLKRIPGVDGLPDTVKEMVFNKDNPLVFTVDRYKVTVEWDGKVTVGDPGEEGNSPSDKTLTKITLSQSALEVNEGETVTLIATMTPTDAEEIWDKIYAPEGSEALYAIGSPTLELYAASFNATNSNEEKDKINFDVEGYGYKFRNYTELNTRNGEIYSKGSNSNWWIASLGCDYDDYFTESMVYVDEKIGKLCDDGYMKDTLNIRPVVCFQTPIFNKTYSLENKDW